MKAFLSFLVMLPMLVLGDDNNKVDVNTTGSQSNDSLVFNVTQIGYNNDTIFTIGGSSNSILIKQEGNNNEISFVDYWGSGESWGGDLDGNSNALHFEQVCDQGSSCLKSDIGFHVQGSSNAIRWGQGRTLSSSTDTTFETDSNGEKGGHKLNLDVHSSGNSLAGYQQNSSSDSGGHTATVYLYGGNTNGWIRQQDGGEHSLSITTNNSDNEFSIRQKGDAKKTATISLSGSYGTDLTLLQQGTSTQTYNLTQNCVTAGGCTLTMTQE